MCQLDPLLLTKAVTAKSISFVLAFMGSVLVIVGLYLGQYYDFLSQICPDKSSMDNIGSIIDTSQAQSSTIPKFADILSDDTTCREILFYGQERCQTDGSSKMSGFELLIAPKSTFRTKYDHDKCPKRWIAISGAIIAAAVFFLALVDTILVVIILTRRPNWGEKYYNWNFIIQFVFFLLYCLGSMLIISFLFTIPASNFPCKHDTYKSHESISYFHVHPNNRRSRREALVRELPIVEKINLNVDNLEYFLRGAGVPAPTKEQREKCASLTTWVFQDIYLGLGGCLLFLASVCSFLAGLFSLCDHKKKVNQYKKKVTETLAEKLEGGVNRMSASAKNVIQTTQKRLSEPKGGPTSSGE